MMGWQWHQLDHMQIICILTYNHASTSPLSFCMPDALPATQPTTQSTIYICHANEACIPSTKHSKTSY